MNPFSMSWAQLCSYYQNIKIDIIKYEKITVNLMCTLYY